MEVIYSILKPGGIWINLGPLLYHFSDVPNEDSIEPTYEDLIIIIRSVGFNILVGITIAIDSPQYFLILFVVLTEKQNRRPYEVRPEPYLDASK